VAHFLQFVGNQVSLLLEALDLLGHSLGEFRVGLSLSCRVSPPLLIPRLTPTAIALNEEVSGADGRSFVSSLVAFLDYRRCG
jgi:hypothetical protein